MNVEEDNNEWANVTRTIHKCPHCENGKLDTRIKRGFFVRYFCFWLQYKRYQCNTCERKVYIKIVRKNIIA